MSIYYSRWSSLDDFGIIFTDFCAQSSCVFFFCANESKKGECAQTSCNRCKLLRFLSLEIEFCRKSSTDGAQFEELFNKIEIITFAAKQHGKNTKK